MAKSVRGAYPDVDPKLDMAVGHGASAVAQAHVGRSRGVHVAEEQGCAAPRAHREGSAAAATAPEQWELGMPA